MVIDRDSFLKKLDIEPGDFRAAGMPREELAAVYEDYQANEGKLCNIGRDSVYDYLCDIEKARVHSYRYRTRDPGHPLEKTIHKRNEQSDQFETINRDNYYKYVTDLTGIRVFFLYQEDWVHLHSHTTAVFENDPDLYVVDRICDLDENPRHCYVAERPKVYRRNEGTRIYGDSLIEIESDGICRSLHYIIRYRGYCVEIQGRTLFEEGWSEIDHNIVYPYFRDSEILKDSSTLLNRLSGTADEMGSHFRRMRDAEETWERKLEEDGRPGEWEDGE